MPEKQTIVAQARTVVANLVEPLQALLAAFCVFLLATATVYAMQGKVDIATALIGILLVSILILIMPRLQSFKAPGIEATFLAEQVRKAEITVEQFKKLARSAARLGFHQVAENVGMQAFYAEKRAIIEALNDSMTAAELDEEEAAGLRRPLFDGVAEHIRFPIEWAAAHLRSKRFREIEEELKKFSTHVSGVPDPNEAAKKALEAEKERMNVSRVYERPTADNLARLLDACNSDFKRTPEEDIALRNVIISGNRILKNCIAEKNIVADLGEFTHYVPRPSGGWSHHNEEHTKALLRSRFANL